MTQVSAEHIGLKYSDDESLTISRKRNKSGFSFFDAKGNRITDKPLLKRLRALIIPPMWTDVQVSKWDDGHIQAVGRDLKGRKQYIYHSLWEKKRQEAKFLKMQDFGKKLPKMIDRIDKDIHGKKWNKSKVLAILTAILDETGIRVGNRQYADRNGTYGLTTLRRKHMEIEDDTLIFEYKGKSNKERHVEIDDSELIKMVKMAAELPGYEIFRYKDSEGSFETIDSDDVNEYVRATMGDQFSSKDFRTWVASRIAIEMYPKAKEVKDNAPRRKFSSILIRLVADQLGNTPSVCKSYYVHPTVLSRIADEDLPILKNYDHDNNSTLYPSERLLVNLLSA